jgi:hypothetical protein
VADHSTLRNSCKGIGAHHSPPQMVLLVLLVALSAQACLDFLVSFADMVLEPISFHHNALVRSICKRSMGVL